MKHDRRSTKRFCVKDGAMAFLDAVPGTIIDISEAGIAVNYVIFEKEPEKYFRLDIFFEEDDFFLPELAAEVVTDGPVSDAPRFDGTQVRRLGLRFCELTGEQKDRKRSPAPHLRPIRPPHIAGYRLVGLLERICSTGERLYFAGNAD